jgi:hypothetical protein
METDASFAEYSRSPRYSGAHMARSSATGLGSTGCSIYSQVICIVSGCYMMSRQGGLLASGIKAVLTTLRPGVALGVLRIYTEKRDRECGDADWLAPQRNACGGAARR